MRPSSSSDPNAPYRAAIASLVDCNFFANEQAEQPDVANAAYEHCPFNELSPRRVCSSDPSHVISDAGPSSASNVTVDTIKDYLRERGHVHGDLSLKDTTIEKRLNSTNISIETLLTAIKIACNPDHPLLATLSINPYERYELINRLDRIVSHKQGFRQEIKSAMQKSNNDPEQLIANILNHLRNLFS